MALALRMRAIRKSVCPFGSCAGFCWGWPGRSCRWWSARRKCLPFAGRIPASWPPRPLCSPPPAPRPQSCGEWARCSEKELRAFRLLGSVLYVCCSSWSRSWSSSSRPSVADAWTRRHLLSWQRPDTEFLSYKTRHTSTLGPSKSIHRYLPKMKTNVQHDLYKNVHSSFIHNGPKLQTTPIYINRWLNQ